MSLLCEQMAQEVEDAVFILPVGTVGRDAVQGLQRREFPLLVRKEHIADRARIMRAVVLSNICRDLLSW